MKMLKKLAIPVLLLTVLSLCIVLVSCKKDCAHEFGEWDVTKEATCTENGERVRTCSICNETEKQTIKASHEHGSLVCGVCGETVIGIDSLFPTVNTEGLSSFGIVVKDVLLSNIDPEYPEYDSALTVELAELVVYLDENDALKGYADGEAVLNYVNMGDSETASVFAFLDDGVIYVSTTDTDGESSYITVSLSSAIEGNPEILEAMAMLEAVLPTIEAWLTESFLPCFTGITLPEGVELPELNASTASNALTSVLDLFFTVENTDGDAIVALDLSVIKEINNALNEKTIAEVIDLIGGEGAFLQLRALIPSVLDFTVSDLITFITLNLGVDIPALLESLDELAVLITGAEEATFEMLVGIEADIDAILANEALLATSVKAVLIEALELTDEEELTAFIDQILETLNATTLYRLLEIPEEEVAELNEIVDMISEMLSYEITVGADGKFVSSTLAASIPEIDMYITVMLTPEKLTLNANDGKGTNGFTVELVPDYTPNFNEEKAEELKAKFENLPAINEEIVASRGIPYLPIYDNDVLVGAIVLDSYTNFGYDFETELSTANIFVYIVDFSSVNNAIISAGCGSKAEYEYTFSAVYEARLYSYDEDSVDLTATDFGAALFELVLNDAPYYTEYSESDSFIFDFYYDTASGELVEDADHSWIYDEENSVDSSVVDCGEKYYYYYACENCDAVDVDAYLKDHGDGEVTEAITFDEATATYTAVFTCECGEVYATNTYTILDGDVSITADEDSLNDGYPEIDFCYTITEAGTYRFIFNSENSGYVHIYQRGYYVATPYFGEYYDGYIDLELDADDGYFTVYFYDELDAHDISFGIGKIG